MPTPLPKPGMPPTRPGAPPIKPGMPGPRPGMPPMGGPKPGMPRPGIPNARPGLPTKPMPGTPPRLSSGSGLKNEEQAYIAIGIIAVGVAMLVVSVYMLFL